MSGPVTFKVEGLSELDAALGELTKATAKNVLRRVGISALGVFVERASGLAPDDPKTGSPDLHTSVSAGPKLNKRQASLSRQRDHKDFVEVYAGTNDVAGVQTEFGNAHQAPEPWMRPAWEETKDQVLKNVADGLKPEIDKAAARARAKALKKAAADGS